MPRLRRAAPDSPGYTRVRKGRGFSFRDAHGVGPLPRGRSVIACVPWRCHLPGKTCGSLRIRTTTFRRLGWTPRAGFSTSITPRGASRRIELKFERMLELARVLPAARRVVTRDLAGEGLTHSRVLAGAFRLLDTASVRPGAVQYTDQHGSYGITTLLGSHASVHGKRHSRVAVSGKERPSLAS